MTTQGTGSGEQDGTGAREYDEIARTVFAPIYPVIARQAIAQSGIESGLCIDAGCGPGHLGIAMAAISGLRVDALDSSPAMLACAEKNIREAGMGERVRIVHGDVHALPYPDGTVDLVVSRGSIFFWEAPARAFAEIRRVLRPGGRTFIGGGFGTPALKAAIFETMRGRDPSWDAKVGGRLGPERLAGLRGALEEAGVPDAGFVQDESGFWIVMRR
jgi:ubiquinone/menaquinone biosynthesis C-methylase UbiE